MTDWTTVATTDELQPGDRKAVFVDDEPVLLVRIDDDYLCVADVCTHDGQPLGDGPIADGQITCTRHGARFDLTTGDALCMPATEPVAVYSVQIDDGQIRVRPGGAESTAEAETPTVPAAGQDPETDQDATTETAAGSDAEAEVEETAGASAMLEALREVIDPELMVNIVDLGLIYDIREEDDEVVSVDMTLTSPACPAGPQLVQQSKMALERLEGVTEAQINLVMTPPWTPERMTDDARDKLGIF